MAQCSKCAKKISIDTTNEDHFRYGAICPHCKNIMSVDVMMTSIIKVGKNDEC